jgi:hypothetical protein
MMNCEKQLVSAVCLWHAVDALDHLARRVSVVKRQVEPKAMIGQVGAERIGRPPAKFSLK